MTQVRVSKLSIWIVCCPSSSLIVSTPLEVIDHGVVP
jgi:hypothetical protein